MARLGYGVLVLGLLAALAACGDTWSGLKKDTSDNMQATGAAIENAGKKVEGQ